MLFVGSERPKRESHGTVLSPATRRSEHQSLALSIPQESQTLFIHWCGFQLYSTVPTSREEIDRNDQNLG